MLFPIHRTADITILTVSTRLLTARKKHRRLRIRLIAVSYTHLGTDYDKTFKTDKNGEIFIDNLRIGEYTVSEVNDKASAGYILPADKQATIKVDATTVVQMHNEFRDTPKTGDDFNPCLLYTSRCV